MAPLDAPATQPDYDAPQKDLYEIGEIPPLGYVPKQMYAWRSAVSGKVNLTRR